MSRRATLRRELKAERAGIAASLGSGRTTRLTKRERPDDGAGGGGGDASDDDDDASRRRHDDFEARTSSWPKLGPRGAAPRPRESYDAASTGPAQARLDAERIAAAEAAAARPVAHDDDAAHADCATEPDARAKFKSASAAARKLAAQIRQRTPNRQPPRCRGARAAAAAAAIDPKDAAAQLAAARARRGAAAASHGAARRRRRAVSVTRLDDMQEVREALPILGAEHDIVDAINDESHRGHLRRPGAVRRRGCLRRRQRRAATPRCAARHPARWP